MTEGAYRDVHGKRMCNSDSEESKKLIYNLV